MPHLLVCVLLFSLFNILFFSSYCNYLKIHKSGVLSVQHWQKHYSLLASGVTPSCHFPAASGSLKSFLVLCCLNQKQPNIQMEKSALLNSIRLQKTTTEGHKMKTCNNQAIYCLSTFSIFPFYL